jgi:hypothetical protein
MRKTIKFALLLLILASCKKDTEQISKLENDIENNDVGRVRPIYPSVITAQNIIYANNTSKLYWGFPCLNYFLGVRGEQVGVNGKLIENVLTTVVNNFMMGNVAQTYNWTISNQDIFYTRMREAVNPDYTQYQPFQYMYNGPTSTNPNNFIPGFQLNFEYPASAAANLANRIVQLARNFRNDFNSTNNLNYEIDRVDVYNSDWSHKEFINTYTSSSCGQFRTGPIPFNYSCGSAPSGTPANSIGSLCEQRNILIGVTLSKHTPIYTTGNEPEFGKIK